MSSTAPTTVANSDLIQELSWQKLQYCTMVIRIAQHMNMVYCNRERERGLAAAGWPEPSCASAPAEMNQRVVRKRRIPSQPGCTPSKSSRPACTSRQRVKMEVSSAKSKTAFSTGSLAQFSRNGVLYRCLTQPLFQELSTASAYLCKKLGASPYEKEKKKGEYSW